ncbi:MAG: type II secretion system F family protein [Candidatus Levybacteria bacterium]|nr:type II secretion system F family protein [Candidatus Levybacteria bacterium]
MTEKKISISNNDRLGLISNLSTMLSAGIPILETIDSLLEDSKGNTRKVLEALKDDLSQGKHVYHAFSRFPKVFDTVTVNIIKASEEAGTLDVTLKDVKENIKKEAEFSDRVKSALVYPIIVMVVFIALLFVMLIVVIPRISSVFTKLNMELPLPTKILIFVSDALISHTALFFTIIAVFIIGLILLYRSKKDLLITILSSLPLISHLIQDIDLTRFTRSLSLLLNAGIPITSALELTQTVVVKKNVAKAIEHAKDVVSSGKKLSQGFKDAKKIFPVIMIKITEAGERSGSLDKAVLEISEYLEYQVSNTLKALTTLLEPVMLVVVGVFVGGMMLAIIAPIYGLISQIGSRGGP